MSTLNVITPLKPSHKLDPEVLIELPDPKRISEECTIIMNGHHNYGMNDDQDSGVREDIEEMEPFLDTRKTSHSSSSRKSDSLVSSNSAASTLVSSNAFPLRESSIPSSPEEDSDVDLEPESSTHLLQNSDQIQSPKGLRTKPKLPNFKSSPSKKQSATDAHSHIQHRPLGMPQSTLPSHAFSLKLKWSIARLACLGFVILFILAVLFLIVGLYFSRSSDCSTRRQWWQGTVMYEIFPASFLDTDGDGFGDMKGVIERLDYVQNLSIDVIRLNSIFSALDYPLEYEHVIDFTNLDPHLGKMEDFEALVREIHSRGMYVILDMNPTVTSDQHTWAAHWLLHRKGQYEHFYINITDNKVEPPLEEHVSFSDQNWKPPHRTFGSHLFLNWSNPMLQLEMRDVLETWLSLGIDGFYMKHLEDIHVANEAHVASVIHQWRYTLDKYSINSTRKVLMMSHETYDFLESIMDAINYLPLSSMVDLVDMKLSVVVNGSVQNVEHEIQNAIKSWGEFSTSPMITWHVGSVETMRLAGRVNDDCNLAAILLLSMLSGSVSSFYGDEIGLKDSVDPTTLKAYRGGQLVPMQWTSEPQANFTNNDSTPWMPLHTNYKTVNAETQFKKLITFKQIVELKKDGGPFYPSMDMERSLVYSIGSKLGGTFLQDSTSYEWYSNRCGLLAARTNRGEMDYVFIGNFGTDPQILSEDVCPGEGDFIWSVHDLDIILSTNVAFEGKIELNRFLLEPGDAILGLLIT
ncbi:maltase A2-like [Uloborus diversus]|uniref:maltase A2-like n=1 Tax=Uloborus diversus TaxID=327109 RepID=UPI0024094DEB|nr:maltase A2-like [Uloborus diversus]